jgi:hypothetical protein
MRAGDIVKDRAGGRYRVVTIGSTRRFVSHDKR